ncbi:topoisomerase DNA-binding C4 zinc finger domain-containing protein [Candidatus Woesearchaeota archaeon]|nr:topoisomerase DNA-binding C4 zinc finger domain-containing protein [Candidatus Woesearchaeota archaeon]
MEAYKTLRISPKETLALAQNLYINGYISYPRTSSNQLPPSLNYRKILEGIARQLKYKALAEELLKRKALMPNNGKKTDSAHPAIYATSEIPKKMTDRESKLYDLIVHRILATFADNAVMETVSIELDVKDEIFLAKGTTTKFPGWHKFYGNYVMQKENELPEADQGQILKVKESKLFEKETQPPKRYTPASIIKELEKNTIGTKATRSEIIDNLYQRNYIKNESIEVTDIGLKTIETLEKYCPEIIDIKLTRHFEEEMDQVREKTKKSSEVLDEAKDSLTKTLKHFKQNEKEIGNALGEAAKETRDKEIFISKCPACKEGDLQVRKGKYGSFAACNRYEQGCSTTFALPKNCLVKSAEKNCDVCGYPKILAIRVRRKPQEICINPDCKSKKLNGKTCPKCGSSLVVKTSHYGSFLACPGYPKCKYIEKLPKE